MASSETEAGKEASKAVAVKHVVTGTFKRAKVIFREFAAAEAVTGKAPALLAAFPSAKDLTATITSQFFVEQMKLPLIGVFSAPEFFPAVSVIQNNQPTHAMRLYGDGRLVVVVCVLRLDPKMSDVIAEVADLILDFCQRHRVPMIYSVSGMPLEELNEIEQLKLRRQYSDEAMATKHAKEQTAKNHETRQHIRFVTTSATTSEQLLEKGHKPLHSTTIEGINGHFLSECTLWGDEPAFTSLFCPVSKVFPDAWGSVHVTRLLDALTPTFDIDLSPLEEQATKIESKIKVAISSAAPSRKPTAPRSMYG